LDGVVPVLGLVPERTELPVGGEPAAGVLVEHGVAGADSPQRIEGVDDWEEGFVVGRALNERREGTGRVGSVEVGAKDGPIAHRHVDVPLAPDLVVLRQHRFEAGYQPTPGGKSTSSAAGG